MKEFKQYKIKAKDLQEKAEIIGLLEGLGYRDDDTDDEYTMVITYHSGKIQSITDNFFESTAREKITIEQLREMVVKEYLDKDYILRKVKQTSGDNHVPKDWVEVPEGAECLIRSGRFLSFWKEGASFFVGTDKAWDSKYMSKSEYEDVCTQKPEDLWQRNKTESLPSVDELNVTAWDSQIGGSHYKDYAIQPLEFALANNLDAAQHAVVKYVMRHKDKNGIEDLKKAKHYIDLMIEHYY